MLIVKIGVCRSSSHSSILSSTWGGGREQPPSEERCQALRPITTDIIIDRFGSCNSNSCIRCKARASARDRARARDWYGSAGKRTFVGRYLSE